MSESLSIEWIVGIARQHPAGGSYRELSEYDAVATVTVDGTHAHIKACHGTIRKRTTTMLVAELRRMGITKITWDRADDGGLRRVEIDLAE